MKRLLVDNLVEITQQQGDEEEKIRDLEAILLKVKKTKEQFGTNPDLDERIEILSNSIEEKKQKRLLKG